MIILGHKGDCAVQRLVVRDMFSDLCLHISVVVEVIANVGGVIKLVLANLSNDQVWSDNLKMSCQSKRKHKVSRKPHSIQPRV